MTRPKNPHLIEKEARLQEAIDAVLSKKYKCHTAALAFKVPRRMLYDRVNGNRKFRPQAHELAQILSNAEEKELVRWITRLTITGYPPRHVTLLEMADEIRKRRVKNINDESMQLIEYPNIGTQWVSRFLRRHPELVSVTPRSIDAVRVKDTSPERLTQWFEDLRQVIEEYDIKQENMYNMDESGFAIGEKEATRCIINAQIRQQYQAKPGRQEWVTAVECICADGTVIPPLIIFRAENLSREWIPATINGDWKLSCNSKGWTSNEHGIQWLRRCFEPFTREKAAGAYRLLICDGHDSHITGEWIAHCMNNNIILMILPPHSSHLTQPLDVGVFGPLKKYMAAEIEPLMRTGVMRVQKVEWLAAFIAAHNKAFSIQNIQGGFRGTGIYPFLPTKVLNRVSTSPTCTQTRTSTPPIPTTPFNETVLTSSPIDVNAVREANTALIHLIDSSNRIPTPAKDYVRCLTRSTERLHALNTILEREKEELKTVVGARKRRLSGKRRVIEGKHVVTAAEILKDIQEAEIVTRERKAKKGRAQRKREYKARKESIDESEEEPELSEGEEMEIFDCIEVEM